MPKPDLNLTQEEINNSEEYFPQQLLDHVAERAHETSLQPEPHIAAEGRFEKFFFPMFNAWLTSERARIGKRNFTFDERNQLLSGFSMCVARNYISTVISFAPDGNIASSIENAIISFTTVLDIEG